VVIDPSTIWHIRIETAGEERFPMDADDAIAIVDEMNAGTIGADGTNGDFVELQFDRTHSLLIYAPPGSDDTLRPRFPDRKDTGDGVDELFCDCCGIPFGDEAEILAASIARADGLAVFRDLVGGARTMNDEIEWVPFPPLFFPPTDVSSSHAE